MKVVILSILILFSNYSYAQKTLSELLEKHNDNSIPYITAETLLQEKTKLLIFDSRELKEYNTSHIENAICVGYDHFNIDSIKKDYPDKGKKIIIYCSLGIRSETIGKELKKAGYTNLFNLYGGIFEWKNKNFVIIDSEGQPTEKVHTFNKAWSKWLIKGEKIYEKSSKKNINNN